MTGDHPSWDSILEEMSVDPDLSPDELVLVEDSFRILSEHLGSDFPALSGRLEHPLHFGLVTNKAAFPKKWLIWLASSVQLLAKHNNFPTVRRKLRSKEGYRESMSFVRFCYRLAKSGWKLHFEPDLSLRKNPDLQASSPSGIDLIVEITSLGLSDMEKSIELGVMMMVQGLAGLSATYSTCGRLYRAPRGNELERIKKACESFRDKMQEEHTFTTKIDPGLLELAGAPREKLEMLNLWAKDQGIKPDSYAYVYPATGDDLLRRISGRLKRKSVQASCSDSPGLIAIHCNQFTNQGEFIIPRCDFLGEELSKYPGIIGLVLFGEMWKTSENVCYPDPTHVFIETQGAFAETERWVFVPNPIRKDSKAIAGQQELCEAFAGRHLPRLRWALNNT